jgi:micrococcal nuclease
MILLALAAAVFVPSGQRFECRPVEVNDGDTFRCSSGVKVRLRAIDAPEMPGHCRRGRQCAPGDPFASKRELTHRVAGRTLQCVADGRTHRRTAAWCSAAGVDLSCAQFRGGYAIREAKFDRDRRLCR